MDDEDDEDDEDEPASRERRSPLKATLIDTGPFLIRDIFEIAQHRSAQILAFLGVSGAAVAVGTAGATGGLSAAVLSGLLAVTGQFTSQWLKRTLQQKGPPPVTRGDIETIRKDIQSAVR